MVLTPVGPLPASTYWRRRLVLLVALVAVLLVAKSCAGSGGSPTGSGAAAHPTPTHSAGPTPTPTIARSPGPPQVCPDSALRLVASTDVADYPAATTPHFTLTVTNTSRTACKRNLGASAVEFLVFSGAERIWSGDDCTHDTSTALQLLRPGQSLQTSVRWQRVRSRPGCPAGLPATKAGTYVLRGRLGTLQAQRAVFRLSA